MYDRIGKIQHMGEKNLTRKAHEILVRGKKTGNLAQGHTKGDGHGKKNQIETPKL